MSIESYNHHHYFPEEVIIEILSRLPVKPLLKFKSVCKNWYAIIKNPNFITKHLHNHYDNDDGLLLVQRFIPESRLYGFELFTDRTLTNLDPFVDPYLQNTAYARCVLGPLNGLYLLFNRENRLAIWNPGTREFKVLPSHPMTEEFTAEEMNNIPPLFAFGFDPSNNDYKVIWYIPTVLEENNIFLLYTLSNDSWRELKVEDFASNVRFWYSLGNVNTYWNGFYYWMARLYDDQGGEYLKIYALDVVDEVFSEIQGPPAPFTSLTMYNGHIACFVGGDDNSSDGIIEIWVMESVGFWTKQLTIGPLPNLRGFCGCWINGGIFFETEDYGLMLCNPNQELRDLGPRGSSHVYIHKESLVSLKGGNDDRKEDVSCNLIAPIRNFFTLYPRTSCIYG